MKTIVFALLSLALPVLAALAPDTETVQGHMKTCPLCIDPESNPNRCVVLKMLSLRDLQWPTQPVRRVGVDGTARR